MWAGIAYLVQRLATGYGPGIESRCGRNFLHVSRLSLGLPQTSVKWHHVSFPEVKRPGRGFNHAPHLAPRIKKEYSYTDTLPLGLHGLFEVGLS
jgi:hypothetical protein